MSTAGPYLILLAEAIAFYRQVLFHAAKFVIPWDFRYYHFPLAEFVAKSFREGRLPLWEPFTYCGWPLYAELTSQVFYPPTVVATLLSNAFGGRHLIAVMERELVAHVFLGGVFAYLLLKQLGTGSPAALAGASVYELGPFFASQTQHLGAIDAAAWLPLSWLAVVALGRGFEWRWFAALAISFAMSLLSGFPALTVVAFCSSLLLAAVLLSWRTLAAAALACAYSAALVGIQILPTIELSRLSIAQYRADWLGDGGGLPLQSLVSLLIPDYWGIFQFDSHTWRRPWNPTFLYLYFGLLGLAFIISALAGRKSRYVAPFAIVACCFLFWSLGENTPVGRIFFHLLPGPVKSPIYAEFGLAAFALAMAVLAGLGVQLLLGAQPPPLQCAAVAACAIELILVSSSRPMNTSSIAFEPGITYERFAGSLEIPARTRRLVNQTYPPARIDTMKGSVQWAGMAPLLEIPTATGDDPMALARFIEVRRLFCQGERWWRFCEVASLDSPILGLLNVRYVFSNSPLDAALLEAAHFRTVDPTPSQPLYENPAWQSRFFLVSRTRGVAGMAEALAAMRAPNFDPRVEAIVEPASACPSCSHRSTPLPPVTVLRYTPQFLQLQTDSPVPAYLVTSEAGYPGWRAWIDGRPQPLYMTNAAFRGMPVPAGRHIVEMRFAPAILLAGAALSAVSWLLLAAL